MPEFTKTAFWMPRPQPYALAHLSDSHNQVLYQFGEYVILAMMWRVPDFEAGLVERCPVCATGEGDVQDRIAKAYGYQSDRTACPSCFGTTFDGGIRARVVRPAIISDRETATVIGNRGEVTTDTVAIETTSDVFIRTGDYVFRSDGTRYRTVEMSNLVVRTGFESPNREESIGGVISSARLEDPASVAYAIPPDAEGLKRILIDLNVGRHLPSALSALDYTPGPLIP